MSGTGRASPGPTDEGALPGKVFPTWSERGFRRVSTRTGRSTLARTHLSRHGSRPFSRHALPRFPAALTSEFSLAGPNSRHGSVAPGTSPRTFPTWSSRHTPEAPGACRRASRWLFAGPFRDRSAPPRRGFAGAFGRGSVRTGLLCQKKRPLCQKTSDHDLLAKPLAKVCESVRPRFRGFL